MWKVKLNVKLTDSYFQILLRLAEHLWAGWLIATIWDVPSNLFTAVPEIMLKDNLIKP